VSKKNFPLQISLIIVLDHTKTCPKRILAKTQGKLKYTPFLAAKKLYNYTPLLVVKLQQVTSQDYSNELELSYESSKFEEERDSSPEGLLPYMYI